MNRITVGTADLRNALTSVAPHADPDAKFPPLHRIHLAVDRVNVTVSATNRYTAAMGLVSVEDPDDEPAWSFDLSPTDVKEILALFRGAPFDDDEVGETLQLKVDEKHTTVTDNSGLFDGKSLTLPRYPDESNFPEVPRLVAAALARPPVQSQRLVADGKKVALFRAAARAYNQPLVLEPTGANTALLVSCGESFIGLVMPIRQDEENDLRHAAWRQAWEKRLPAVAVQDELEVIPEKDAPEPAAEESNVVEFSAASGSKATS